MRYEQWGLQQEAQLDSQVDEYLEQRESLIPQASRPTRMKAEKMRVKETIKKHLTLGFLKEDIRDAIKLIHQYAGDALSNEEKDFVIKEFSVCQDSVKTFWEDYEKGLNQNPVSLSTILNISEEAMMHIYHIGDSFLQDGEPIKAQKIFGFLVVLEPKVAPFWLALGYSYQHLGSLIEALEVYQYGKGYDEKLGHFYLFSAECYKFMGKEDLLTKELKCLEEIASQHPEVQQCWKEAQERFNPK